MNNGIKINSAHITANITPNPAPYAALSCILPCEFLGATAPKIMANTAQGIIRKPRMPITKLAVAIGVGAPSGFAGIAGVCESRDCVTFSGDGILPRRSKHSPQTTFCWYRYCFSKLPIVRSQLVHFSTINLLNQRYISLRRPILKIRIRICLS